MPLGIMLSDISFDLVLVVGYAYWLFRMDAQTSIPKFETFCVGFDNYFYTDKNGQVLCPKNDTTIVTSNLIIHLEELYNEIPSQLTAKPRFFYSFAFIVLPWFFYAIEFCHSRHLTKTIHKVCLTLYLPNIIKYQSVLLYKRQLN